MNALDACAPADDETPRLDPGIFDLTQTEGQYLSRLHAVAQQGSADELRSHAVAMFLTTSEGRLALPDLPTSRETALILPIAGAIVASDRQPTDDIVFALSIPSLVADSLEREPLIEERLTSPADRVRIDLHLRLLGQALFFQTDTFLFDTERFRDGDARAEEVESNTITFPVELCVGCLVPACGEGERIVNECIPGQDIAGRCERE